MGNADSAFPRSMCFFLFLVFHVVYFLLLFFSRLLVVSLHSSPAALASRASLKLPPLRGLLQRAFSLFAPPSRLIPIQTAPLEACLP